MGVISLRLEEVHKRTSRKTAPKNDQFSIFWDSKGFVLSKILSRNTTATASYCCKQFDRQKQKFANEKNPYSGSWPGKIVGFKMGVVTPSASFHMTAKHFEDVNNLKNDIRALFFDTYMPEFFRQHKVLSPSL